MKELNQILSEQNDPLRGGRLSPLKQSRPRIFASLDGSSALSYRVGKLVLTVLPSIGPATTASQADKIRKRLAWPAGILNGEGGKPKGLHWATYRRLKAEHDRLVQISFHDIGRKLGFLHKLLG